MIEINTLRGGSPTVTVGDEETKKITTKARIVAGTAAKGTTIHTTLQIEAIDPMGMIITERSCPHLLEVGKGGQGATLNIPTSKLDCAAGDVIVFSATFYGNENDVCDLLKPPGCELASEEITRTCK